MGVILLRRVLASAMASALLLPCATGWSAEPETWQFGATVYGWFPDITGKTSFAQETGGDDFTVDIEDILDNLEFTFQGTIDARRGQWGIMTDVIYLGVGQSRNRVGNATIGRIDLPVGARADVDLDIDSWIWTLAGYYRSVNEPTMTLDAVAGLRYLDVEQSIDWDISGNIGSIPLPDRSGSGEASLTHWDAIVGLRGRFAFGENNAWFVPGYIDVGTGDSDLTWQAMAGVGYTFRWGEATAAWRYLSYDMPSGNKIAEVGFNGPAIGATFRW